MYTDSEPPNTAPWRWEVQQQVNLPDSGLALVTWTWKIDTITNYKLGFSQLKNVLLFVILTDYALNVI